MANERKIGEAEGADPEVYEALFEFICEETKGNFLREGECGPSLIVLTKLGLTSISLEGVDPSFDRTLLAKGIGDDIRSVAINVEGKLTYDKPMAVILASEAWVVDYDKNEYPEMSKLPPRLHPKRKEILQVMLRTPDLSFCRNWPIENDQGIRRLGDEQNLPTDEMISPWVAILTDNGDFQIPNPI